MKRTEPSTPAEDFKVWSEHATPEEIAYWHFDAATLTVPKIIIKLKQCLNDHEEAVRNGDDTEQTRIRLQIGIYAEEYGRRLRLKRTTR